MNYCINKVRKKRNSLSRCRPHLIMTKKPAAKNKKTSSSTDQAPRTSLENKVESTVLVKNDRIGVRWRGQKVLRKRVQMGAVIRRTKTSTTITVRWGTALSLKTCLLLAKVTMTSVRCPSAQQLIIQQDWIPKGAMGKLLALQGSLKRNSLRAIYLLSRTRHL